MPISWYPRRGITRQLLVAALAALLAFATLTIVPGTPAANAETNHTFEYVLVFQNGQTVSGVTNEGTGNTAFVPDVGGDQIPSVEDGMFIHMSCSDDFNLGLDPSNELYGYSATGDQPELGVDTAWRIADYAFRRVGTNGGRCGNQDLFEPSISVDKSTATPQIVAPGGNAEFDVVVTNTGSETVIIDSLVDQVTGEASSYDITTVAAPVTATSCSVPQSLDPGDDYTCSFTVPVTGSPGTTVEDTVTASGEGSTSGTDVSDVDSATVQIVAPVPPTITITKSASPTTLPEPGGDFDFTVVVTNTSSSGEDVLLTKLTDQIEDDDPIDIVDIAGAECEYTVGGAAFDPSTDWIPAGESITCTWTRTLMGGPQTEDDVATAAGVDQFDQPTNEPTDDETIEVTDLPSAISLDKTGALADDGTPSAGDTIEYEFLITNEGQDVLNDVTLDDPLLDDEYIDWDTSTDAQTGDGTLSPGESVTGYGTYTLTQDDIDNGNVENCATTEGTPVDDDPVSDEDCDDTPLEDAPGISVVKDADTTEVIARDTVEFTIEITNTGNVTLTNLSVEDVLEYDGGPADLNQCENPSTTTLAPGASTTITCEQELDSTTHGDGVTNTVSVSANPPSGPPVTDSDEVPVDIVPPDQVVGGAACLSQDIPGYGFTLDQPLVEWESTGWGPTFDSTQDTLELHMWMNTQDPTTDAAAIVYDVPWTSDLLGEAPFDSASDAPPAGFIVYDGDQGYLYWPGYDDSGWTGPENGLEGIVYPGDEWRPAFYQFRLNPQTSGEWVAYPQSTPDCAPGGALAIEKLAGPQGTPAGDAAFVDVYNRPSNETAVTWQITVRNLTDYTLLDVVLTDVATPACEAAFASAVQSNESGNFMDPREEIIFTCDDEVGQFTAKINTAVANATDPWGQDVKEVQDDAATQSVLASAQIGDTVWADENENGIQDNGEKGIAGATVRLTLPDNSTVDTTTNSSGLYLFSALPAGTYKVEVILSSIPKPDDGDLKLTTAGSFTVTLADGETYLDADFGVASTLPVTGFSSIEIAIIGLILFLAGTTAVTLTRRKDEGLEDVATS